MSLFERRHMTSLLVTRSWAMLSICVLSWSLTMLVIGPQWQVLSGYEQAFVIAAGALILAGLVLASRRWSLWLLVVAMIALGSTALVPSGALVWTYPATYFGYVGFFLTLLLPRSLGFVTAVATAALVWGVWLTGPDNVAPESFVIGNGALQFLRVLGSQLMLWWAWNGLVRRAASRDDRWDALRDAEVGAIAAQERSALWREQAGRVHATLLNSINALLESRRVDPDRLRVLAAQGRSALEDVALPTAPSPLGRAASKAADEPVNAGIVILTSALAGMLIAGSVYAWFVSYVSWIVATLTIAATLTGNAVAIWLVVRQRRIRWSWGLLAVLPPAAVPWLLATDRYGCDANAAVTVAAMIAGFAIVCIGLWSGAAPFIVGLLVWATGAVAIAQATDPSCQLAPTVIILNVAAFLPLAVVFTLIGARVNRRDRDAMEAIATTAALEDSRAASVADIDAVLVAVARSAADRFDAIAAREVLNDDDVRTLACLSGQLRASVQVDQGVVEGFARAAATIIWRLADQGIPVEVGVLATSSDTRPMPDGVLDFLIEAASTHPQPGMRIQSVASPEWELLSLSLSKAGAESAGLNPGSVRSFDDVTVEVSEIEDDASGLVVATVERQVRETAPASGGGATPRPHESSR